MQAPLAGGASTPALAAAVGRAGALGFLASGYKTADALAADIAELRDLSDAPFGVNLFAPAGAAADPEAVERFASRLRGAGHEPGQPRHDDDDWEAKLALLAAERPAVVSLTFGCPDPAVVEDLRGAGSEVWVTVTSPPEAETARAAGADAVIAQGIEAGGHRAAFSEAGDGRLGLLALLALLGGPESPLPVVASGGIATAATVAAVRAAGARAAQVGTAFMLCPEAGTSDAHRRALAHPAPTRLTRAFTGKPARGIENAFMTEHGAEAPGAYPELHHLTAPIRAAARRSGEPDALNLWAGQAHELAPELPAAEVVALLCGASS